MLHSAAVSRTCRRGIAQCPVLRQHPAAVLRRSPRRGSSTSSSPPPREAWWSRAWDRYTHLLSKHPLAVKCTTASLIFFTSDTVTQTVGIMNNNKKNETSFDVARAASGAAFGVFGTVWLHFWWGFLEGAVARRIPLATHRWTNTLVKVGIDQALAAPCYIYSYYVITNFVQQILAEPNQDASKVLQETSARAGDMLWPTMLRHWTLWPAVHTWNFYSNPLHHRVLVQNLVLVGWSAYLSHLNHGGLPLMTPEHEIEVTIQKRLTAAAQQHHGEDKTIKTSESVVVLSNTSGVSVASRRETMKQ